MKKSRFLTALLAFAMMISPLTVSAEEEVPYSAWFVDDSYSVSCDTFQYSTHWSYGITLDTELTDANFMVSGIAYNEDDSIQYIVLTSINGGVNGCRGVIEAGDGNANYFPADFSWSDLQLGDLLKFGDHIDQELVIPIINPTESVEVLGNGVDLLGEEFRKVIRHELIATPHPYGYYDGVKYCETLPDSEMFMGDVNEDEKIGILDVIKLNRYTLGSCSLGCYSKSVADVDNSGVLDATDSLLILKEVVGLTEHFEEV